MFRKGVCGFPKIIADNSINFADKRKKKEEERLSKFECAGRPSKIGCKGHGQRGGAAYVVRRKRPEAMTASWT